MIHLGTDTLPPTVACDSATAAACGAKLKEGDQLVEVALHSDCVNCRAVIGIGPRSQVGCALREPPRYTSEPTEITETLEQIQRRRDGF